MLEDARGNPVAFQLKTNGDNTMRVAMANFIKDDLAKVGIRVTLSPVDFNTLITNLRSDFQYEAILLGLQSGVPPDPTNGQNVWRSSGISHYWFVRQQKPATPEEARIDQLMDEIVTTHDIAERKSDLEGDPDHLERAGLVHLAADPQVKLPVSNRFGNVQPSIMRIGSSGTPNRST